MSTIYPHIANANGELDDLKALIASAFDETVPIVEHELKANKIDIIFVSAAAQAMPEYGIGGYSPGPNHIYVSLDPASDKISKAGLVETLLHETHHCMRWRQPGYGTTLGEAIISEGMACLYEAEHRAEPPMFAAVNLSDKDIKHANTSFKDSSYDHSAWFFGTTNIPRWFGYSYGYQLCKAYAEKHGISARDIVNLSVAEIFKN